MAKEEVRDQWATRVAAFRKSGQTQHAWCTAQDVSIHQLKYWLYKHKEDVTPNEGQSRWFPLRICDHEIMSGDNALLIKIGNATVEVKPGFDQKHLLDVLKTMSTLC